MELPLIGEPAPTHGFRHKYCGQYALWILLKSQGVSIPFKEIYQETNPAHQFTSPGTLLDFLDARGFQPKQIQNGEKNQIKGEIREGKAVLALVSFHLVPHWVALTGFSEFQVQIRDSMWAPESPGHLYWMDWDLFLRIWEHPMGPLEPFSFCRNTLILINQGDYFLPPFHSSYGDLPAHSINRFFQGSINGDKRKLALALSSIPVCLFTIPIGGLGRFWEFTFESFPGPVPDLVRDFFAFPGKLLRISACLLATTFNSFTAKL